LEVSLAKLSRNYAKLSSRISSKEEECASRVVGDICRILFSTITRSVCTLYWNKNINTFWIDDAFYYKIKSCALIGTPCILQHKIENIYYLNCLDCEREYTKMLMPLYTTLLPLVCTVRWWTVFNVQWIIKSTTNA
jgi:hypothetical protein